MQNRCPIVRGAVGDAHDGQVGTVLCEVAYFRDHILLQRDLPGFRHPAEADGVQAGQAAVFARAPAMNPDYSRRCKRSFSR